MKFTVTALSGSVKSRHSVVANGTVQSLVKPTSPSLNVAWIEQVLSHKLDEINYDDT